MVSVTEYHEAAIQLMMSLPVFIMYIAAIFDNSECVQCVCVGGGGTHWVQSSNVQITAIACSCLLI